jgi:hypothetical protein
MKIEDITNLEVVWYETFNTDSKFQPVEGVILQNSL